LITGAPAPFFLKETNKMMNETLYVGTPELQENLHIIIYNKPVRMGFQSEQEGRDIYVDETYIRIQAPGDQLSVIDRPITEFDKRRFPFHWKQFEMNESEVVVGTPITEWAAISRSFAEELKANGFRTVESLANASDTQLQRLQGGMSWRVKAQAYLKSASDTALVQKQASELEKQERQMADLKSEIERLALLVDKDEPRQRGRPKKVINDDAA